MTRVIRPPMIPETLVPSLPPSPFLASPFDFALPFRPRDLRFSLPQVF